VLNSAPRCPAHTLRKGESNTCRIAYLLTPYLPPNEGGPGCKMSARGRVLPARWLTAGQTTAGFR
jgi:hypothetical protein